MQYANGDAYEGSWECDVKTGHGVLKWGSTQQQYTGQWKGNKPDGLGTHLWFQAGAVPESPTHALLLMYNRCVQSTLARSCNQPVASGTGGQPFFMHDHEHGCPLACVGQVCGYGTPVGIKILG